MPPKKSSACTIQLYEKINIITLKKLLGAKELDENTRNQLLGYYKKYKNGTVPVKYAYSKNLEDKGRVYAEGALSLQSLKKELRCALSSEYYWDIDMVNAHPVLLSQYCNMQDPPIPCDKIIRYVNERKKILDYISRFHSISEKAAKTLVLRLCYGGAYKLVSDDGEEYDPPKRTKFLTQFQSQLKSIASSICSIERDIYEEVKNNPDKSNTKASVMSILAQILEHKAMMAMYDYFKNRKNNVGVLCFDGIMVEKSDSLTEENIDEVLKKCEQHVYNKIGYNITLAMKPMDVELSFPLPKIFGVVESDGDCRDQLFSLEGKEKFKYCKKELYIYDDRTGLFSTDIHVLYYYLEKHKEMLRTSNGLSYGESTKLQQSVVQAVKTASLDETWLKRTESSSLGYLLFKDGIYDMKNSTFTKGFNPSIVFHASMDIDFPKRNEKEVKYAFDLSLGNLFEDPIPMQVFLARSIAGDNLKRFYLCPGKSNSGKSSLALMLKNSFGSYIGHFNAGSLAYTKNDPDEGQSNRWAYLLRWCRIVTSNEVNMRKTLDGNMIKKHSGRDVIKGRLHGGNETDFIPHYTLWCMMNDIPTIEPCDEACEKRLTYVKFPYVFGGDASDGMSKPTVQNFENIITSESFIRGFIHVILDGYKYYLKNGMPATDEQTKKDWTEDSKQVDVIRQTIEESYILTLDPSDKILVSDIVKFKKQNASTLGSTSSPKFNEILRGYGLTQYNGSGARYWKGIKHR